ncbi:RNA-directed DNA polymerase mobile like protein [Argiope bruennichi]|uniref:RNA-directed DNA polymerase mobile like protein n=1 Tax=Argiope bruennichi TaxID=94029 RepID=A0A8T0FKM9_ARGBR|nr:RNA-directed DNA polymerase mobile like protein [Argiope bruennichi]
MFTFDLETLFQISSNQIICGDYNAKHRSWNNNTNTPRGNTLKRFANNAGLEVIAPADPTRYGYNSETTIDIALVKDFLFPYKITSLPEMSSDHNPVALHFHFKYTMPDITGKTKTNWKNFNKDLSYTTVNYTNIDTPEKIENLATQIEEEICNAKNRNSNLITNSKPRFDPELLQLNAERNSVRKQYQRTKRPETKRLLNLNNKIRRLSNLLENKQFVDKLVNLSPENQNVWDFVRPFKKKKHIIPTLKGPTGIAQTDLDKANFLASFRENPNFKIKNPFPTKKKTGSRGRRKKQ